MSRQRLGSPENLLHQGKELRIDADRTGMGWKAERRIEGEDTIVPTSCKMERPQ
jgi:hypothetical protein